MANLLEYKGCHGKIDYSAEAIANPNTGLKEKT